MKKIIIAMIAVIMVLVCALSIVGCKDKTNPLANYLEIPPANPSENFSLDSSFGGYDLEWTSNNSAIVLTKKDNCWEAVLNRPETGSVDVVLTVKANGHEKNYNVTVSAIELKDIVENYSFGKTNATVTGSFELDRETTYAGKTANISWSIDDEFSKDYIELSEDGYNCVVYTTSLNPVVRIKATFTYNGETANRTYKFTVSEEKDPLQLVDYWYNNTGVSIELSGYLVSIGIEYSEQYGNVTLYMVNDDFTAGYYIFRAKCDATTAAKLVPGVHVTVTESTNTNFSGLIETNAGGKLVVDEGIQSIDISTTVKAIDDLVIGALPETIYNESRLVSLSNWKVTKVADKAKFDATKTFTVLTLEKAGKEVTVAVSSKYLEGAYKANDATWNALCGLADTYKVNDVVSVTGILGCYNDTWQIMPLSTSDVTVGTADPEGTVYNGQKVADALAAVNNVLTAAGADGTIRADKVINLPLTSGDVSIKAVLCGSSKVVAVENNVVTVTPAKKDLATLKVTYTVGEFTAVQFVAINSEAGEEHVCAHVCETCGKCTDANCTNEVCADKCTGHEAPTTVFVKSEAPFEEGKAYYFAINQTTVGKTIYAVNAMNGYYGKTVDTLEAAEHVYVEKDGDNYLLYFTDGTTKTYISYLVSGTYVNYKLVTEGAKSWTWDAENGIFVTSEELSPDDKEVGHYYIGTFAKNETFGISAPSKLSGSFPAYLGEVKDASDVPTPEHVCAHVCPTCGKCTDANCTDPACADKCTGHEAPTTVFVKSEAPFEEGKAYYLAINQTQLNKTIYVVNGMAKTYYGATVDTLETAENVYVEKDGDNYLLYFTDGTTKTYISYLVDGTHVNYKLVTEGAKSWTWDAENKIFVTSEELAPQDKEVGHYYLGTFGSNETLSISAPSKLSTSFPAYLGEVKEGGEVVPPTHTCAHVCETCGKCTDANCTDPACADKCAGHGPVVVTVAQALELADTTNVIVTGVVTSIGTKWNEQNSNMSVTITDGEGAYLYIYKLATQVGIGDTITVTGEMATFANNRQIAAGATATIDVAHVCADWTEADCNNAGKCVVCGLVNAEMPALGHVDADEDGICDRCNSKVSVSLVATFTLGADGEAKHNDGNSKTTEYSEKNNGYTLELADLSKVSAGATDIAGTSCLKLGTTTAVATFSFTVADDVNVVVLYVSGYKATAAQLVINGEKYNVPGNEGTANDYTPVYMEIKVDVSANKTVEVTTTEAGRRAMIDTIEYYA